MDLWAKNTVKYILSYVASFLSEFITLKLAGQIPNAGLVYEALGLGGGIVFAFEAGVRFWIYREKEAFWTAFMVRSALSMIFFPLIVLLNPLAVPFLLLEPFFLINARDNPAPNDLVPGWHTDLSDLLFVRRVVEARRRYVEVDDGGERVEDRWVDNSSSTIRS